MFPIDVVRIMYEMIPLELEDEIAQRIHWVMFAPRDECDFCQWTENNGFYIKNHCQLKVADLKIMAESQHSVYEFYLNVDKHELYHENDNRTITSFSSGVNEEFTSLDPKENYKLPLLEHIYLIAGKMSGEIRWFQSFNNGMARKIVFDENCQRRTLFHRKALTFSGLCKIFC